MRGAIFSPVLFTGYWLLGIGYFMSATIPNTQHPVPNILALETSGRIGSIALAQGPTLLEARTLSAAMKHATELAPTIAAMTAAQNWAPADIHHIYVSTGPGSFTGLRVAIAFARALSQATGAKLVAVPTLDVLARNAPPDVTNLVVLLDAKRGQTFAARFQRTGPNLTRVEGPTLVAPAEIIARARQHGPVWVTGEGVDYHRDSLGDAQVLDKSLWPGLAQHVHTLGLELATRGEFTPRDALLPVYIRLAEAEELWRKRQGLPLN